MKTLHLILTTLLLACAVRAKDDTNEYAFIDKRTNAVWEINHATNGLVPLTSSNDLPKLWFPVGEVVHYNVYWGILHVANTTVSADWMQQDGKLRLRIRHLTKSNRVIATLYPVEDALETVIDPQTFLPVYFTKKLSEGDYRADELTVFDHAGGLARQGSFRTGHVKGIRIEPDSRDIVTMMYWMRREPFTVGATNTFRVLTDQKIYDFAARPTAELLQKVASYGKVKVSKLEPDAAFNGLFVRKGKITAFVSADDRRLCTRIDASVPFADIHIELEKVTGPGDDAWVAPKKK